MSPSPSLTYPHHSTSDVISSVEGGQGLFEHQKSLRSKDPWCPPEDTEPLSWPSTSTGTTQSLRCPNSDVIIKRTCSESGEWGSVDPSLCTPFNQDIVSVSVADMGSI